MSLLDRRQSEQIERHEPRNIVALAVHHIILRVAWVFKTESVIIPAFLDSVSSAGWLRGCLPILNRIGQSLPPLLFAERLRHARLKKIPLAVTTFLMAIPFLVLAVIWRELDDKHATWLPPAFLVLYVLFFSFTGLNQLSFGTIQGKLIRPERRGQLMALAGIPGSVLAISAAWFLLREWLYLPNGGFDLIFAFTGTGFLVSGLAVVLVREPKDPIVSEHERRHGGIRFREAIRKDVAFRRLLIVGMLFITAQLLFPHYQALGRRRPGYSPSDLMYWVIAQNAGAGFFAFIAGRLADRHGNRTALWMEIVGAALTPVIALVLAFPAAELPLYWMTFFVLGTVPTAFRTFSNYVLELTTPENHPRYLSILRVAMAIPLVLSPVVGLLIDWLGFIPVFGAITGLLLYGCWYSRNLIEPRFQFDSNAPAE